MRLFCLPYAGGGAGIFRNWERHIPSVIEVCAVQLPGRERRLDESLFTEARPLAAAISQGLAGHIDKPFAFFGHSMGAILSFEIAHLLKRRCGVEPVHLFISGRRAPQLPNKDHATYTLPDQEFIEEVRRLNGTPVEVLENPELMELIRPILRADFQLCQTYQYAEREPLSCPITVFGGLGDNDVSREQMDCWREHTTASFSLRMLPGDHFFLHTSESTLLQVISRELLRTKSLAV